MLGISNHPPGFFMDGHGMATNYAHQALSQLGQLAQLGGHPQQHHNQQQTLALAQPHPHPQQGGGQHSSKNGKKCRADYSNALCAICNAPADGLHYGAISCRSCNAFFRRAVTFKQTFICRKGANCDVDVSVRCACRACRLAKCKAAGMRECDVQPKRDPTGSQKNRRAPQRRRGMMGAEEGGGGLLMVKKEAMDQPENSPNSFILPSVESFPSEKGGAFLASYLGTSTASEENPYQTLLSPSSVSFPPSAESGIFEEFTGAAVQFVKRIKKEEEEPAEEGEEESEEEEGEEEEEEAAAGRRGDEVGQQQMMRMESSSSHRADTRGAEQKVVDTDGEQAVFAKLVQNYREHLLWMNRSMTPIQEFLGEEFGSCSKWRVMEPADVEQLSKVELSGLMYWIDKLVPFRRLEPKEREILFKRYSMRKLSLDHFYTASKYPQLLAKGHFGMLNNTFVPPDRTGFETVTDDKHTREAKFQILRPTIDRLWHSIVMPFANLQITDAEVVALHLLLMWSPSNNRLLSDKTRQVLSARRDWTMKRLFRHYQDMGHPEPSVRMGEILLLLPELEVICDMHCKDFQVAQLFEFCNMSEYWYESYCYTTLSIA